MTDPATTAKSIIVERRLPHPPAKVWHALTDPALVSDWLMETDFRAETGAAFTFRARPVAGWSGVTNCRVLEIDPPRRLVYSWGDGSESVSQLRTIVTWTLTPDGTGTLVRMEQAGFEAKDETAFKMMGGGWVKILERLEAVAA